MSVGEMLSGLVIGPLKLLLETIFALVSQRLSLGFSIVILSLAVNLLVLPLYKRADEIQDEERQTEARLKPWVDRIKAAFKGDEQYMMLQTFYRQNHYSPMFALKGAVPLLLEIPFFIAAYQFLSNLEALQGASFGPVRDLGKPDGLLTLNGMGVNVLPILMTAVNLISSFLYTKGAPLKSKIQLIAMALVFLVLLYPSPAGLTLYWTLNNVFSLVKNLLRNRSWTKKAIRCGIGTAGSLMILAGIFGPVTPKWHAALIVAGIAVLLAVLLPKGNAKGFGRLRMHLGEKPNPQMFFLPAAAIALLLGMVIPSAVVVSAPGDFLQNIQSPNPLWYMVSTTLLSAGTFVLWLGVYYALATPGGRKGMELGVWILLGLFLINYIFFQKNLGTLSYTLQYDETPVFSAAETLINLGIMVAATAVLLILALCFPSAVQAICISMVLVFVGLGGWNGWRSWQELKDDYQMIASDAEKEPVIRLSKNGKNVVILMLDRAIGSFMPVMAEEKPELKEMFSGFVYYPNTLSYGAYTIFGAPGLFGGYDYTPEAMNQRSDLLLKDKHNEALLLLPTFFSQEGYGVTVLDPPYADYKLKSDLSIYDDLPDTQVYRVSGRFTEFSEYTFQMTQRNFFCYALTRTMPTFCFGTIYHFGDYNHMAEIGEWEKLPLQSIYEPHHAVGRPENFLAEYDVLRNYGEMTRVEEDMEGALAVMLNCSTHEPVMLQEPDYSVEAMGVNNEQYDAEHEDRFLAAEVPMEQGDTVAQVHYQVNMASMLEVGHWMEKLKAWGVYDNTRIIIVSDHGRDLHMMPDMVLEEDVDLMQVNPLLLVKDFGAEGPLRTDRSFMTNCDTPALALEGIVDHPVNPFTGNLITMEGKQGPQRVTFSNIISVKKNSGNTFRPGKWYEYQPGEGTVFDPTRWHSLGIY